jgi:membrane carboxypeptidase/penicillin-binding protein PbpC
LLTIYPPEFRAWADEVHGLQASRRTTVEAAARNRPIRGEGGSLVIANPPAGAIYSVDPTLRREFQALPLRAVANRPTTVTWLVDGALVGSTSSERTLSWPLAIGAHDIEARDADGRRAKTSVIIR